MVQKDSRTNSSIDLIWELEATPNRYTLWCTYSLDLVKKHSPFITGHSAISTAECFVSEIEYLTTLSVTRRAQDHQMTIHLLSTQGLLMMIGTKGT
jgi:hypothetical protein